MAARLTPEQRALRAITESTWQSNVQLLMKIHGWTYYHPPANRPGRNGKVQQLVAGWPDLVAVRGLRLLAAELKREDGRTTPEQDEWLSKLRVAGVEVYVWRPSDRLEVVRVLSSVSPEPRVVLDM